MAKLYFYYGAMGSSKSANAMMVAFNYRERGQKVLLCKTGVDTRDGARVIKSRMGLESNCELLDDGIVREGAQVMLGANDEYIALCRKHFKEGKLHPDQEVVGLTD